MALMQDLTTKHIIPHMEQKIRALNQQVYCWLSDSLCLSSSYSFHFVFSFPPFLVTSFYQPQSGLPSICQPLLFASLIIVFCVCSGFCYKERFQEPNKKFVVEKREGRYTRYPRWSSVC